MKNKILFILHLPPPIHGASMMGKYIQESHVINDGYECIYINLATAKNLEDIGKFGFYKIIQFIKLLFTITKQVNKYHPEIVYITPNAKGGAFYKDFIVVQLLKILKCKIIAHYHNKGVQTKQDNILDNILYKIFFKNIKVILLSETLYKDIAKYVERNNVFICPNGIPKTNDYQNINQNNITQLLYLSNLQIEKGIIDVLDACKILKEKGYSFECNLIGGETNEMNKKTLLNEISIRNLKDCVIYQGKKYGNDKDFFYKKSDIFIFPTYYHNECFPVVLLEAMQHHCVCISTNEGGISDIIDDGINGFVVNKRNPFLLADKIETLVKDKELMNKMKKAGYDKFIKNFTIEKYEFNIYSILNKLI